MRTNIVDKIKKEYDVNIYSCTQCFSCSNGCPFINIMDYPPHMIIRYAQLGFIDKVLSSKTPWICVGCNTCSFACPMSIDIPTFFDAIKEHIIDNNLHIPEPKALEFHQEVLNSIKKYGKTHKLEIIFNFKLKNFDFFTDLGVGLKMLFKRKIHLTPPNFNHIKEIKKLFNNEYEKK